MCGGGCGEAKQIYAGGHRAPSCVGAVAEVVAVVGVEGEIGQTGEE